MAKPKINQKPDSKMKFPFSASLAGTFGPWIAAFNATSHRVYLIGPETEWARFQLFADSAYTGGPKWSTCKPQYGLKKIGSGPVVDSAKMDWTKVIGQAMEIKENPFCSPEAKISLIILFLFYFFLFLDESIIRWLYEDSTLSHIEKKIVHIFSTWFKSKCYR